MKLDLSVLEFGHLDPPKVYAHHAIQNLFSYAQKLDALGFKRFWLSEHYGPEFGWHSPEILLPLLAGYTENIKIGQAGVLLKYHSPFRIAHNFSVLNALFSGRIDLGFVPAGMPEEAMKALMGLEKHPDMNFYKEQVQQLIDLLDGKPITPNDPMSLLLPLQGVGKPDLWVLGTSGSSISAAVEYQANFCISLFHIGAKFEKQKDAIKAFKEQYFEKHQIVPPGLASVICICSESEKTIAEELEITAAQVQKEGYIIGKPEYCKERLYQLAEEMNLDEIVINISGSSLEVKDETADLIGAAILKTANVAQPSMV